MRIEQDYLQQWISYWAYLSNDALERWFTTTKKMQSGKYSVTELIGDAMGYYGDAALAWYALLKGPDPTIPTVLFDLRPHDNTANKTVPIFGPALPEGKPQVAFLEPLVGGGHPANITARNCLVSRKGYHLEITLQDLLTPTGMSSGVYHGLVHIADRPVARLYIVVRTS